MCGWGCTHCSMPVVFQIPSEGTGQRSRHNRTCSGLTAFFLPMYVCMCMGPCPVSTGLCVSVWTPEIGFCQPTQDLSQDSLAICNCSHGISTLGNFRTWDPLCGHLPTVYRYFVSSPKGHQLNPWIVTLNHRKIDSFRIISAPMPALITTLKMTFIYIYIKRERDLCIIIYLYITYVM